MTDATTQLAAALADRYTIEREIGAGGMATVPGASATSAQTVPGATRANPIHFFWPTRWTSCAASRTLRPCLRSSWLPLPLH